MDMHVQGSPGVPHCAHMEGDHWRCDTRRATFHVGFPEACEHFSMEVAALLCKCPPEHFCLKFGFHTCKRDAAIRSQSSSVSSVASLQVRRVSIGAGHGQRRSAITAPHSLSAASTAFLCAANMPGTAGFGVAGGMLPAILFGGVLVSKMSPA